MYRVIIKYCAFSFKRYDFSDLCQNLLVTELRHLAVRCTNIAAHSTVQTFLGTESRIY